jgi:signal transduction histidine kinase
VLVEVDSQACQMLNRDVSEHLYRIAQEALANAMKHASATTIHLCLRARNGGVQLQVRDDGRGPASPSGPKPGMGLNTMRDRAEAIGGTLTITVPSAAGGTVVICDVPSAAPPRNHGRQFIIH